MFQFGASAEGPYFGQKAVPIVYQHASVHCRDYLGSVFAIVGPGISGVCPLLQMTSIACRLAGLAIYNFP